MPPSSFAPAPPVEGFEVLAELALDLLSAWNHRSDMLWSELDPELWHETGNPWLVVQSASRARMRALWATPTFRATAESLRDERRRVLDAPAWFQRAHPRDALGSVAFFSMEFALAEALPLYSGGLGNVAGDYLKAGTDLGVPLVGVGILHSQQFRQGIDANGNQIEFFPFNEARVLPVVPMRDADGEWVRVRLPRPGPPVWLRGWEARVGRVKLYLLDSNDPTNTPADRGITAQLYGEGVELRLLQEMVLGIGGWRLLRAIGLTPDVCHMNEGHAAFVALERARDFMEANAVSFEVALAATRAGNVFTTHTPVEAGFDRFTPEMVTAYLGAYVRDELRVPLDDVMALGRANPSDTREPLSMAWLAARASVAINGVARSHAAVSRRIFAPLFPRWPESNVPIDHVTNGVHVPSWDSAESDALWTTACGPDRWRGTMDEVPRISTCSDETLWAFRAKARADLVSFVRERLPAQLAAAGMAGDRVETARHVLDPDALTIGMARRFTGYKRPALLLTDEARFARLLLSTGRPVQIVVAGKAHPSDADGKGMVARWVRFARRDDVRAHVVFLADYDLRLAERLVRGVDLWLNTPLPPWEACGTSGMKVLVNGGLNLSSLDGWWAEAYRPELGWMLPHGRDDGEDAATLYSMLERDVVPAFYERDPSGIPRRWVARMRESMTSLTPTYSANRAVREYTERFYLPAAASFRSRSSGDAANAKAIAAWARHTRETWPHLHFGETRVATEGGRHHFSVTVYTDGVGNDSVAVELWADAVPGSPSDLVPMKREAPLVGASGFVCVASVPATRPATDYTARAVPCHADVRVPLELPLITWAR